VIIANKRLLW